MDPGDLIDAVGEITDLVKRPKRTIAKKTLVVYGLVVTAGGAFCGNLYGEPALVAPCDGAIVGNQMMATTSLSSITATTSVVSSYTFTT